jgi:hypothetical protein
MDDTYSLQRDSLADRDDTVAAYATELARSDAESVGMATNQQ